MGVQQLTDELDDIQPKMAKASDEVVDDEPTAAAAEVADDMDVEFGDSELMKNDGLIKLMPEKGKVVRASILDFVKPKKGYTHHIKGKGTFRCLSKRDPKTGNILDGGEAICCQKGEADLVVAALAVHYTNAPSSDGKYQIVKDGDGKKRYKDGIEWDLKWVKLSRSGFRTVSSLPPEELVRPWAKADDAVTVYDIDFTFGWRTATGGGYNYNYAGKARWRTSAETVEAITAACKPYLDGKKLVAKLGKVATVLEYKAALAGATAGDAEEASLGDVDAL